MSEWMRSGLTPERELSLSLARREIPRLNRQQLEGCLDSALCDLAQTRQILHDAMRRISELEIREGLGQAGAARRRGWVACLRQRLGMD
jgi:hypothetical protein